MSKMYGVRIHDDEYAAKLDKIVKRRKTTVNAYLEAVICADIDRVERNWVKSGMEVVFKKRS